MRRSLILARLATLCTIVGFTSPAPAQAPTTVHPPARPPRLTESYRIAARAAPAPVPAFKYRFLPEFVDQVPGNAAFLYITAGQLLSQAQAQPDAKEDVQKMDTWMGMHPSQLPRDEVRGVLSRYQTVIDQLREARLRDRCDFESNYRTKGFGALLTYLNDMRALANLMRLRANLHIGEGKFREAVDDLGVIFTMARHLNEQPFIIQVLVSTGLNSAAMHGLQHFIPAENSPNLYWALGDLPNPLADVRAAMQYERAGVYFTIPQLKDARDGKITAQQWNQALVSMTRIRGGAPRRPDAGPTPEQFAVPIVSIKDYTLGKRYLVEQMGMPREKVEAMEVAAVVGIYQVARFERYAQEYDKWLTLPFWQGIEPLMRFEQSLAQSRADETFGLAAQFLPALSRAVITVRRADRTLAAWRTVEALRAYAAANGGKLPERLEDIADTPAPIDPMTDEPFRYSVEGLTATVEGPPVEAAGPVMTGIRIDFTLVK